MSAAVRLPLPWTQYDHDWGVPAWMLLTRTGNKPPWTLPAKAAYSGYDSARAKQYFGAKDVKTPDFFPILSLLPQRALCFVREQHPDRFVSTFLDVFEAMWKNGKDVSKPDMLAETLQSRFSSEEAKTILSSANSAPFKQRLNDNTKEALDRGAFGAPWFWVRNANGAEEPFFGSDRYATAESCSCLLRVDPYQVWCRRQRTGKASKMMQTRFA